MKIRRVETPEDHKLPVFSSLAYERRLGPFRDDSERIDALNEANGQRVYAGKRDGNRGIFIFGVLGYDPNEDPERYHLKALPYADSPETIEYDFPVDALEEILIISDPQSRDR